MGNDNTSLTMQVKEPGAPLTPEEVAIQPPAAGFVRVTVHASGVCYADTSTAEAPKASPQAPVTPGHEIAGVIAELGDGIKTWQVGDKVAVGWFGGSCGECIFCRRGDVVHCAQRQIPGLAYPGGYAQS